MTRTRGLIVLAAVSYGFAVGWWGRGTEPRQVSVEPSFATERIDVTFEDTGRVFRCDAEAGVQIVLSRCEETP